MVVGILHLVHAGSQEELPKTALLELELCGEDKFCTGSFLTS